MNYKKIITVTVAISLFVILSVSYVHAQTLNNGLSNAAGSSNSTLTFGFSNSTGINPPQLSNSTTTNATSLSSLPYSCIRSAELQVYNKTASFDMTKATSLSNENTEFKSRIQGYSSTFDSNFDIWSLNKTNCTPTWKTTNLVYDIYNGTSFVKRVVVTEDPALTTVLNITEQHPTGHFSNAGANNYWSGYEFAGDGNIPPRTPMLHSYSIFTVPTVSIPTYPNNACRTDIGEHVSCALATWVGLEDEAGANPDDKLAQTGAAENITCTSSTSCSYKYSIWYEFLASGSAGAPVYCTGLNQVNAGDSIAADIYNDTNNGGTDSHRIDVFTVDTTNSSASMCTMSEDNYFTITPIYSSFITEDPLLCSGDICTLPHFNSVQMTQNLVYYDNSYQYISTPYSNGWFNEWNYYNIDDTSITNHDPTGQDFTETWNPNCSLPGSGTWTVTATCTVDTSSTLPGSVIVQNGAVLRVPGSVTLTIDFSHYNLQVNSGGGVLIDGSSVPNAPLPGGAIK